VYLVGSCVVLLNDHLETGWKEGKQKYTIRTGGLIFFRGGDICPSLADDLTAEVAGNKKKMLSARERERESSE
jgi:hypothetical protein